ncbi:uracil-DNA glycosylase family 4 [Angulomicrobium tetraedrale]|uniref:Type-5 uracil-DNA glycosylase n=1 Tax=Ancylobacter tetraedralis TaxID=217068 RepID=A0A839ZE60_9HYPH|nr:uracil-DNA glycosylase [Ancylobacter tetraedralis]MBB3772946.1 uracil-DNA glycosylase family 4 [Ancylobacter tetraedralis]
MKVSPIIAPPTQAGAEPARDCPRCPRLVAFREHWRTQEPAWHNAPVPSFGPEDGRLLIVGLAPGLRGANRTGRPFTGDYAGELLYSTLIKFGFATGAFEARPDDSLRLRDARLTNAVRCVPPENKPTTDEIRNCRPFFAATIGLLPALSAIVALGKIAHDQVLAAHGETLSHHKFAHGAVHRLGDVVLFDSYHCSRYNTNTGVLTTEMFHAVFARVRAHIDTLG